LNQVMVRSSNKLLFSESSRPVSPSAIPAPHRTGQAVFPHPALQAGSHPSRVDQTVAVQNLGFGQGKASSLNEFYELFPLPRILDQEKIKNRDISFYIPAFRIKNVAIVDRFAARLTQLQPILSEGDPDSAEVLDLSDVWLPLKEAKEMAHVLLFSLTRETHKKTKKAVKTAELRFTGATLLCLPFAEKGIYLRELETDLALQKKALDLD